MNRHFMIEDTDGKEAHGKKSNVISHQGNADYSHELSLHT